MKAILLPVLILWSLQGLAASDQADYRLETVVKDIDLPWGMVWLDNGDMLVSSRNGEMRRINAEGEQTLIEGVPKVHVNGQGGLMDLERHPQYDLNGWLYLSYASREGEGDGSHTAIMRARLEGNRLTDKQVLYKAVPNTTSGRHYGSRIEFDREGYLYFSIGDRGDRDRNPQNPGRDGGKIYRLTDLGWVPSDNPFADQDGAIPAVYSLGHRNPQGMAMHPLSGDIWVHEHGPRGGDEVNLIKAGANYGWPILSYGVNYSGSQFAEAQERDGYESPVHYWDPSIAPSGMVFITSERYPEWRGDLIVGSLKFRQLVFCEVAGDRITATRVLFEDIGRVRTLRQGPDGYLYVATEDKGIIRIVPQKENVP
ncbi:PQQ-dependent sugar dehydrogenase [Aestuariicella hydrocarbonica]|uniref:PQQ-dependent sugar dehydrogenase n=1 Tax=Pseudomaricurvus hydrocarbonicus TaxID=1470433 RepID=A0A9E5MND2_9GAMM|nr:PQQ-dependent sugar dehydrogenase [Aestuariicella hydrocarbonica]NHO67453.1 PQQ-dependent sugar dehydrogenase [Aestuariicella hydrocarbonica]